MEGEWLASCRSAAEALHLCPWRPELACALAGSACAASARLAQAAARLGAASKPERPVVHGAGHTFTAHDPKLVLVDAWKVRASCLLKLSRASMQVCPPLCVAMCCVVPTLQCLRLRSLHKGCDQHITLQCRVWCKRSSSSTKSTGSWLAGKRGGTLCHRCSQGRAQGPLPFTCVTLLEHQVMHGFEQIVLTLTMSYSKQNLHCRYLFFHARRCWPGCMRSPPVRRRGS